MIRSSGPRNFYDANGFGLGSNRSGVILYINMETRDVVACASGETKYVLLNTDLDTVIDAAMMSWPTASMPAVCMPCWGRPPVSSSAMR